MRTLSFIAAAAIVLALAGGRARGEVERSKSVDLGGTPAGVVMKDWPKTGTVAGRTCRTVPQGKRLEVTFARLWEADEFPADAYALRVTYLDNFTGVQRLVSFINREGSWGWNEVLTVPGTGDGKWKTEMMVADGGLLDHDTSDRIRLGLAADAGDWSVAKLTVTPATADEVADARRRLFARINRAVRKTMARMTLVAGRKSPDPGSIKYEPTDADRARGYIPFARDYMKKVCMEDTPGRSELRVFAARGEARPFTFGLRTLRKVAVGVVTSDLTSKSGKTLPAGALEVGYVQYAPKIVYRGKTKYTMEPMHIWPVDRQPAASYGAYSVTPRGGGVLELSANCAHRFWVTLRVPANQPAGTYTGRIRLEAGKGARTDFPLTVQVLPFALPSKGMRWTGCYSPTRLHVDALRDQISHGCTMQSIWHNGADMPIRLVGGKPRCDTRAMDAYMKRLRKLGMTGPVVYFAGNDKLWMFDNEILQAMRGPKYKLPRPDQKDRAYLDLFKDPAYGKAYGECLAALYAHAKQAGWNELVWCPFDEPAKGGVKAVQWMRDARAARQALGAGVRIFCVVMNRGLHFRRPAYRNRDKGAIYFSPFTDIFSVNGKIPEVVGLARKQGKQVWGYSSPNRFTSGFFMLKTGADTAFTWAYNWMTQTPTGYTWSDSEPIEKQWDLVQARTAWFVSYPDVDGHYIPTPKWELWREGCDDNRYIHLLERLLAARKDTPAGRKVAAGFGRLKASIRADEYSKDDAGLDEFVLSTPDVSKMDTWRRRIAAWIVQLSKKGN